MGTTPNFAIPYPEPTDFVADGANQMENLAERSDDALYALGMGRNRLINGDFRVAQRGTSFVSGANNDNTYNLDRWVVLSDGNDIVDITQANVAPSGGLFSIGLDVETVNKKFGILQVIETRNILGMFNQPVTLSFSARTSGTSIGNMKAVILAWTGTGDTVTRDVVSAWNSDGITPTFATNWTAENTPQNLAPSNDWTRYEITANLDTASTNNVAVFIWCDDMTTTLGDFLYITDVQLEVGALATPFERKTFQEQLVDCQRYYENSGFPAQNVPTSVTGAGAYIPASTANILCAETQYKTTKRAAPTVTIYNTNNILAAQTSEFLSGGGFVTNRVSVASYITIAKFIVTSAGQFAAGREYNYSWEVSVEL
jgi:hypothetical protein